MPDKLYRLPRASIQAMEEFALASSRIKTNRIDDFYESCVLRGMLLGLPGLMQNFRSPYQRRLRQLLQPDHPAWDYIVDPDNVPPDYTRSELVRNIISVGGLGLYRERAKEANEQVA